MDPTQIKIIETFIVIVIIAIIYFLINKFVDRIIANNTVKKGRGKLVKKTNKFFSICVGLIFVLIIWGVNQAELAVFVGAVLTVLGIAMFAQWSILSNITSSMIIFFSHNVKLEDTITILDKDYEIEGRISDIGLFFVILKTKDGELVSFPNNIFIQKMIKKKVQ